MESNSSHLEYLVAAPISFCRPQNDTFACYACYAVQELYNVHCTGQMRLWSNVALHRAFSHGTTINGTT